jgi:hypothetical protein
MTLHRRVGKSNPQLGVVRDQRRFQAAGRQRLHHLRQHGAETQGRVAPHDVKHVDREIRWWTGAGRVIVSHDGAA